MEKMISKVEDMEIWKRGCRLAVDIYKLTMNDKFDKDWGLRDQIRRAVVSIPSNIAEGYERDSDAEFKRFLRIAKGSSGELRTQLYIAKALSYGDNSAIDDFIKESKELSAMIQSLISHLKNKIKS